MRKNNVLAFACLTVLLLQGCARNKAPITAPPKAGNTQLTTLQQCFNDATTLVKLNKKHQKDYNDLYEVVNEAKGYAAIVDDSSLSVKSTITPLFDYEINNRCNNISQLLITEFKSRTLKKYSSGADI